MPTAPHRPTVRLASGEDLAALQVLARRTIDACYRDFLGDEAVEWFVGSGASDAHVANALAQGDTHVHCLVDSDSGTGRIVGFSITEGPLVDLMMVDPDHHRRGLGRLLLQYAERTLLARHSVIRLETFVNNVAATAFYEACGWSLTGRLDSDGDGGDDPARVEYVKRRLPGAVR